MSIHLFVFCSYNIIIAIAILHLLAMVFGNRINFQNFKSIFKVFTNIIIIRYNKNNILIIKIFLF